MVSRIEGDKPKSTVKIGGVSVNENDIQSTTTKKVDGNTYYVINFKNGQKVEYPNQDPRNKATISFDSDQVNSANYSNLASANIYGSDKRDDITLFGCGNCTVDVANDKSEDNVYIQDGMFPATSKKDNKNTYFRSIGNKVKMNNNDTTEIYHEKSYRPEGWFTQKYNYHKEGYKYRVRGEGVVKETEENLNKEP